MATDKITQAASVPDMVHRGVRRAQRARVQVRGSVADSAARQAELFRREARWWGVLAGWVYSARSGETPVVFGLAAIKAQVRAEGFADSYEQQARDRAARPSEAVAA